MEQISIAPGPLTCSKSSLDPAQLGRPTHFRNVKTNQTWYFRENNFLPAKHTHCILVACIFLLPSVREKVIEYFFCRPHRSIVLKDNLMIYCFPGSTTSRAKRKKVSKLNHEKLKTQVYLFSRSCCTTSDSELYIACSECVIDYIIFISVKSHNYSILI